MVILELLVCMLGMVAACITRATYQLPIPGLRTVYAHPAAQVPEMPIHAQLAMCGGRDAAKDVR